MSRNRKIILIVSGIVIAVLLGTLIFTQVQKIGKVQIDVVVAPSESTFTIDGQAAQPGINYVAPGKHTLKATLALFTDAVKNIDTATLPAGQKIYLVPSADSPQAVQWLIDHKQAGIEVQGAGDALTTIKNQTIVQAFPYVTKLPYESIDYRIDYSFNNDQTKIKFIVTLLPYMLTSNPGYKQQLKDFQAEALQWFKDNNIDSTKADITYSPDPNQ